MRRVQARMHRAIQVLLAVTASVLLLGCSDGGGKSARAFLSPDMAWAAVLISEVDGGFPGSSCTATVVVLPRATVASGIYPANSRAFVGECHTLKLTTVNDHPAYPNGPQLRWTGPHSLSIVFNERLARQGALPFYSVTSLYEGRITIHNERQ